MTRSEYMGQHSKEQGEEVRGPYASYLRRREGTHMIRQDDDGQTQISVSWVRRARSGPSCLSPPFYPPPRFLSPPPAVYWCQA